MKTTIAVLVFTALAVVGALFALSPTTHAEEMGPLSPGEAEALCFLTGGVPELRGNLTFCIYDRHELAPTFSTPPKKNPPPVARVFDPPNHHQIAS
jgi:hypothetical protein